MLVREHVKAGHDVSIIASTESYGENKKVTYLEPSEYMGSDGASVKRIPYSTFLPKPIMKKIRIHPGVYEELDRLKPDVIMFHGMCGFELLTVSRYVKRNPRVKFYADCHEDKYNSATSFLSRNTLYRLFYVPIINISKKYIDKVLYLTHEAKIFCYEIYGLKEKQLEFFPLGGVVYPDDYYAKVRNKKRAELNILPSETVFFQSGKFDAKKKLLESIISFSKVKNKKFKYYIAGDVQEDIKSEFYSLLEADPRIKFLGWVNSTELIELLCMADVYVQPGSQSATMQMSLAARCAIILDDVPSHRHIFRDNGFLVKTNEDLFSAFVEFEKDPTQIPLMSENSYGFKHKVT
jgi:glycosyltransferase involved in cell wall biosynthesis